MALPKRTKLYWNKIGEGAFNQVYKSPDGRYVFKVPKLSSDQTDTPERAVRIWNQINPDLPAHVVKDKGWFCPFIEGKPSSDNEISDALISIYSKTGRLVLDAACNNFLTTTSGRVICIDVGFALETRPVLARKNSEVSLQTYKHYNIKGLLLTALNKPRTHKTIKALLILKTYRPDIQDASFLSKSFNLVCRLAEQFDILTDENRINDIDLAKIPALDLNHVKRNCIKELKRYINSRGSLDSNNKFSLSSGTYFFRNLETTYKKVDIALRLIKEIEAADTIQKLEDSLTQSMSKNAFSTWLSSGLEKCIINCFLQSLIREPEYLTELQYNL